ncbi:MutS protein msh4 [Sorochytrium milnesiophthora]
MTIYSLYIFDRHCHCIYSDTYVASSGDAPTLPPEEHAKLVYGVIYSVRNMVNKLRLATPTIDSPFHAYSTSVYKLHYYETPTSLKFVLMTSPSMDTYSTRDLLKTIYRDIYVEYVAKNPLATMSKGPTLVKKKKKATDVEEVAFIRNDAFKNALNGLIRARPSTAKSVATTAAGDKQGFIVAMSEARGVQLEVGMAAINLVTGECVACQFIDSATYVKTLHKLNNWDAVQLLIPANHTEPADGKLTVVLKEHLPDLEVMPVARKFFSDQSGLAYLRRYALEDEVAGLLLVMTSKYHCLSSLAALFRHVEAAKDLCFSPKSLRFRYQPIDGTMMIDPLTAKHLELTTNLLQDNAKHTLYGLLNSTKTPMGQRWLKACILQPLTDVETINMRLDAVQEIIKSEARRHEMAQAVYDAVKDFADVDVIIAKLVQISKRPTVKTSEQNINTIIYLKHVLQLILSDERFRLLTEKIDDIVNEDVTLQKSAVGLRNQRCYAVKAGYNGLLDVARQTYKETTNDVYNLVQSYCAQHDLTIKLQFSQQANFYLELKQDQLGDRVLPPLFINLVKKRNTYTFTTLDLLKYNDRINESLVEIYLMSDKTMTELSEYMRSHVSALYRLSESVALLDMLWSFAHQAVTTNYTRPEFTDTLAIKAGRHPVRELVNQGRFVSNDAFADHTANVQIVSGVNMSGKSTYLRQIALISIMAQMGSFVPAEYASHRIVDQLFSRLGNDDSLEMNASSFMLEMREAAYILQNVTDRSLVIIDELGRGTSAYDGVGIAFAICEALAQTKAFVFFATHFHQLAEALAMYTNVVNLHLDVQVDTSQVDGPKMRFLYTVQDGRCVQENYGVMLASTLRFPRDVIDTAKEVSAKLTRQMQERQRQAEMSPDALKRRLAEQLVQRLQAIKRNATLPPEALLDFLQSLQAKFREACRQAGVDFGDDHTDQISSSPVLETASVVSRATLPCPDASDEVEATSAHERRYSTHLSNFVARLQQRLEPTGPLPVDEDPAAQVQAGSEDDDNDDDTIEDEWSLPALPAAKRRRTSPAE